MKHVWFITATVALYGLANGLLLNATPQASLSLHLSSAALGLIGAGMPVGYALSCLVCGRVFAKVSAKTVLQGGISLAVVSLLTMSQARNSELCVAAQLGLGLAAGAFWPFASSWLLDFQSEGIPKTRLLRHYNVAWTSSTSIGMFASGTLCDRGYIFQTIMFAAGVATLALLVSFIPKATPPHCAASSGKTGSIVPAAAKLGLPLVVAAVLANLVALGTRAAVWNTYAELNHQYQFGAERMGMITGVSLASQLLAFSLGSLYESRLGLRRIYIFMSVALFSINLAFAFTNSLPTLLCATFLLGLVLALAFQTAIVAAVRFFSNARSATTFHEATVGAGGMYSLVAGAIVAQMKLRNVEPLRALQTPFFVLAALAAVALLVQLILVGRRLEQRALLDSLH